MADPHAWVEAMAAELGTAPPDQATIDAILELAGVAAHASERWTAPVTCWLAATAGTTPEAAIAVARRLAGEPSP